MRGHGPGKPRGDHARVRRPPPGRNPHGRHHGLQPGDQLADPPAHRGADRPKTPLPHARLHDLRHIHATTLLLAGVPVHVVAARLGHADPSITLRVYAHVVRAAEASAADIFAQAIGE
ncbi:tyrosine-type recombinase/integrase [Nonomuraea sp. NPDC050536]|uniref:tyrosine-type recombinase/integrase n=1 Tax=Nonomuraea sp. NPDC050536 TaxID=3364366 RepID=UPI0037C66F4F